MAGQKRPEVPECVEIATVLDMSTTFTTKEVCNLFGVSELTISNWRKKSGLPYIRIEGSGRDTIRFNKDKVYAWATRSRKRLSSGVV